MSFAGSIQRSWLENTRATLNPGKSVEKWFSKVANEQVIIDGTGGVWLVKSQRWMSQDRIDRTCMMIDSGQMKDL